jgi:hypothetical protein
LTGIIASVEFKGINLRKALFDNDVEVSEVTIFNSRIKGQIPFKKQTEAPKISTLNIRVDSLFFDKLGVDIKDSPTVNEYVIKDAVFKVYDLSVDKLDTFTTNIVSKFDFDVHEFREVSADSMYTFKAIGLNYSGNSKVLSVSHFSIHPNYKDYEFTSLHQFETDRIEAELNAIHFYKFSVPEFLESGNMVGSYVEIGKMDLSAFRDKRKPFSHLKKPAFQDLIYNYPGKIDIDSIAFLSGNIIYAEHAEKANEPGIIRFNEFNAKIYKITNDTIYKIEKAFLELKAEALLMDKGKLSVLLKARIFDHRNTFSVDGTLSAMDVNELNQMLEKNAFIYATSGRIDHMKFSFLANNTKAAGTMIMRYHGLEIAVKNKRTDDTTAIKEQFLSLLANKKIMDSNPIPGEDVRTGRIDYERDPERFLFNYCFKSLLSGIKSSLEKAPKGKEK